MKMAEVDLQPSHAVEDEIKRNAEYAQIVRCKRGRVMGHGDDSADQQETKKLRVDDGDKEKVGGGKKTHANMSLLEPVTSREEKTVNQEKVLTDCHGHYFCALCCAMLNRVEWLVKHITGLEHERKLKMYINWSKNKEKFPFFCEVCSASCTCEIMLKDHLQGKKHAKAVSQIEGLKCGKYEPIPPQLLTKLTSGPPVKKVGNGLSLGLSSTMMKFFNLPGPFIGLKYAEEIGEEGEPSPRYYCYICNTHMDYNNTVLHFTSTTHRHNVLTKDYPDLLATNPRGDAKKDTERCARLASEIEAKEGRKIELIMRKILQNDWKEVVMASIQSKGEKGGGERGKGGKARGGERGRGRGRRGSGGDGRGERGRRGRGRGGKGLGRGQEKGEMMDHGASFGEAEQFQQLPIAGQSGKRYQVSRSSRGMHWRGYADHSDDPNQRDNDKTVFVQGCGGFGQPKPHIAGFKRGRAMSSKGKSRFQGSILSQAYGGFTEFNKRAATGLNQSLAEQRSGPMVGYGIGSDDAIGGLLGERGRYSAGVPSQSNNWDSDSRGQVSSTNKYGHIMSKTRTYQGPNTRVPQGPIYLNKECHFKRHSVSNHQEQDFIETGYTIHQTVDFSMPPTHTSSEQTEVRNVPPTTPIQSCGTSIDHFQQYLGSEQTSLQVDTPGPSHKQHDIALNKADIFRNLALSTIDSEEDAEMALQLSSSLTQALLAYRIKHSTGGPLNELLSAVKGVSLPSDMP